MVSAVAPEKRAGIVADLTQENDPKKKRLP
jgi:hypothetical protein